MEVGNILLLLLCCFVESRDLEYEISAVDGIGDARDKAIEWLKSQRNVNCGWKDTVRIVTALMLAEDSFATYEKELYTKELELAIMVELRNPNQTVDNIALCINALISTSRNPRDFFNEDLVETIRNNPYHGKSVMAIMALCNVNVTDQSYLDRLQQLGDQSSFPQSIDKKALISITLSCFTKMGASVSKPRYAFEKLQNEDGSFGCIYRTALIVQAYLANSVYDEKVEKAIQFLLTKQEEDGSFGNVLNTYLVIPILAGKTLANIADIFCGESCEGRSLRTPTYGLDSNKSRKLVYELWLREDKFITKSILLDVSSDDRMKVFDVMKIAALQDESFKFKYTGASGKEEVYSISGRSNDPELSYYWCCYVRENNYSRLCINVQEEFYLKTKTPTLIFWYKQL